MGRATWWPWVALEDDAAYAAALAGDRSDRSVLAQLLAEARRSERSGDERAESVILALGLAFVAPEALAEVLPLAEALAVDARVSAAQRQRLGHLLAAVSQVGVGALPEGARAPLDAVDAVVRDARLSDEVRVEQLVALAATDDTVRAWALLRAAWIEHGRRGLYLHAEARYRQALEAADGDARVANAAQAGLDALEALQTWRAAKLAAVTPAGKAPRVPDRGAPLDEGQEEASP